MKLTTTVSIKFNTFRKRNRKSMQRHRKDVISDTLLAQPAWKRLGVNMDR